MSSRRCTRCRRIRLAEDFGPDRRRASGRRSVCRECDAESARERRARPKKDPAAVLVGPWKAEAPALAPGSTEALLDAAERQQRAVQLVAEVEANQGHGAQAKALETSLAKLGTDELDAAMVALARSLARLVDVAEVGDDSAGVAVFAPKLQAALKALGLTRDGAGRRNAEAGADGKLRRFPGAY